MTKGRSNEVGFAEARENIVVDIDGLGVWMNHCPIDNSLHLRTGYPQFEKPASPLPQWETRRERRE